MAGNAALVRAHPVDVVVALLSCRSRMFSRGWGDEGFLSDLSGKVSYEDRSDPIFITWQPETSRDGIVRRDGTFVSPLRQLPHDVATVYLRAWQRPGNQYACVIPAASRDEGYRAREFVFGSLADRGIDLYLLENPFYGQRRTADGPSLISVSDQAMMALGMVLEARALLESLRPGYQKLAVAGYSMGGHMAAITAAVTPFPLACAALATGASASSIYTRGLLSWSVDFDSLNALAKHTEAQERLRQFFDAADITRYHAPVRVDAAIIVGCTRDGYVQRAETERLYQHWQGSTLRWVKAGHFSALLTNRRALCDAVSDALAKL